jgi:archaellum biogenesis ATPase FlaH
VTVELRANEDSPASATLVRLDVARMLSEDAPPVEWLIEHVAARGHLTLLSGREKRGKSLLTLALVAACVSGGGSVAGIDCHPCRVLIVDAENGQREIHRRVRRLALDPECGDRLSITTSAGFDLRRNLDELRAQLQASSPDVLVIDSFRATWAGNENDTGEAALALDPLRRLAHEKNIAIVLVHHERKQGGYRGASAIGASVEHLLTLERATGDRDATRRRLSNRDGCRFDAEAPDQWLRIEADPNLDVVLVEAAEPFESPDEQPMAQAPVRELLSSQIERLLGDVPQTQAAVARALGRNARDQSVRRALRALADQGRAQRCEQGWKRGECQGVRRLRGPTPDTPRPGGVADDATAAEILRLFPGAIEQPARELEHDPLCAFPDRHASQAWRTRDGRLVCSVCHPPAHPSLVAGGVN